MENNTKDKTEVENIPKKIRCHTCRKKLKMIHFTCKCSHQFCIIHNNPHTHNCQYDYKKVRKQEIIDNNPIIYIKITKI